jgi:hypothetical protein
VCSGVRWHELFDGHELLDGDVLDGHDLLDGRLLDGRLLDGGLLDDVLLDRGVRDVLLDRVDHGEHEHLRNLTLESTRDARRSFALRGGIAARRVL